MGWEKVRDIKYIKFADFSAGWFPGKEMNDIPGNLRNTTEPVGAQDLSNVIWYDGELQKFPGWSKVNTTALNGSSAVTSIFYSSVLDETIATAGNKLYKAANSAVPVDVTGSVTITPDIQFNWDQWQFGNSSYVIGVNGTNPPIKYDGTTASILGGNPPSGEWVKVWQNAVWIANNEQISFSNYGDGETWSANDNYKLDADITGLGVLGNYLVVFKKESIGILTGSNNRILTKIDKYINGIGCSGGHTIINCKMQGKEVIVFHSDNGIYAFDGSQTLIRLSNPISRKYTSGNNTVLWNSSRFTEAYATYNRNFGWYILALSEGGSNINNTLVILDLKRLYRNPLGIYSPHWVVNNANANCILSANISNESILIGSTDGFINKINWDTYNRNGSSYEGYFQSKIFDADGSWVLQEVNIIGEAGNTDVNVSINADLQTGDGETSAASFADDAAKLDSFVLDTDVIGGRDFTFATAPINNFGRFLRFKVSNSDLDEGPRIQGLNIIYIDAGIVSNQLA